MTRSAFLAVAAAAVLAALGSSAEAASSVHTLTISGQASGPGPFGCATSGPLPSTSFYGGGVPVPVEGHAGCGLAGGIQDVSRLSGLSSASLSLANTFNGALNT